MVGCCFRLGDEDAGAMTLRWTDQVRIHRPEELSRKLSIRLDKNFHVGCRSSANQSSQHPRIPALCLFGVPWWPWYPQKGDDGGRLAAGLGEDWSQVDLILSIDGKITPRMAPLGRQSCSFHSHQLASLFLRFPNLDVALLPDIGSMNHYTCFLRRICQLTMYGLSHVCST